MQPLMDIGPDASPTGSPRQTGGPVHEPTIADVLIVKTMLNKAMSLPPEIVDAVADYAEYWPHTTSEALFGDPPLRVRGNSDEEDKFLLRTPPLGLRAWRRYPRRMNHPPNDKTPVEPQPAGDEFSIDLFQKLTVSPPPLLAHPCRRIVFTIKSHDQGWGGNFADHGTYQGSWTWFEAGLERWCESIPTKPDLVGEETQPPQRHQQPSLMLGDLSTVLPEVEWDSALERYKFIHQLPPREDVKVQCNVTAKRQWKEHRVAWNYTDDIDPKSDVEAAAKLAEEGRGTATGSGKFVRDLKLGDVVTLWAKARFGGWVNEIESVKIDVYYAI